MGRLDQALESLEGVMRDVETALTDLRYAVEDAAQASEGLTDEIVSLSAEISAGGAAGGAPTGGSGPSAGPGGRAPSPEPVTTPGEGFLKRFAAVGAGLEAIRRSPGGRGISQAIVDASSGGSAGAGFADGFNRALAAVPVLGEATGLASGVRVEDATLSKVNSILGGLASRGRDISQKERDLVINEILQQETRREQAQRENAARLHEILNERAKRGEGFRRITEEGASRATFGAAGAVGLGGSLFK